MTNEEAIRIAQGLITDFKCESETMVDFCNTVMEALERTSALDKVRKEIVHLHDWAFSREEILRIIDKYRAESEEV